MASPAGRGRRTLLAFLVAFGVGASVQAQAPAPGLAPGPWAVGFSRFARADSTRPLAAGGARAIDIGVWYPARGPGASRLTLRAYASVARATLDFLDAFLRRDPAARRRLERGGGWPALGRLERLR